MSTFAWNIKACFLVKKKRKMSSAEFLPWVLSVRCYTADMKYRYESQRRKTYILIYESNEDSNQPARSCSFISLRCPHQETVHPWLSKMRPVKILISLRIVWLFTGRTLPKVQLQTLRHISDVAVHRYIRKNYGAQRFSFVFDQYFTPPIPPYTSHLFLKLTFSLN